MNDWPTLLSLWSDLTAHTQVRDWLLVLLAPVFLAVVVIESWALRRTRI